VASDTAIVVLSTAACLLGRFGLSAARVEVVGVSVQYVTVATVVGSLWLVLLAAYRTRNLRVLGMGFGEYKGVVNASVLTFGILGIAVLVFQVQIARGFFIVALPVGLGALLLNRWLWRRWLNHKRLAGHYLSRAIVVGDADDVKYVVSQIDKKSGAAYRVIGLSIPDGQHLRATFAKSIVPVISRLDDVADAVRAIGADAVIVAGKPGGSRNFIRDLGWALEGTGAELVVAASLTNVAGPRIHFRPVEGLPLMHVELPQFEGGKHLLKRVVDVALSGLALLLLMPVFAFIAIAIRRDSAGPVLFRQERVGRNGQTFRMLKFRSMVQTAETDLAALKEMNEGSGLLFKMKVDPRVTRVGQVLRKFSLDELPQFWNILIGHMSLVGPRPPLENEVEGYERHVRRRLYIKPGLTGMWQVNGRSDLSWEESVRLDLYYVENWSLTGDLIILWRTFNVLTHPVGAY
jgi:exopolysaccharide biosynthesis polyprenyl glycosylphosphotransferase